MNKVFNPKKIISGIRRVKSVDILGLFVIIFFVSLAYLFLNRRVEYLELTMRLMDYEGPEYSFGSNKPRPWYVEQITPGKKQKDGAGRTLIEVVDIYSYPGPSVYYDAYVTLNIRASQNRITSQYIYNGSPLLIHDIRSFKVGDILLNGEIVDMISRERATKKFRVKLELNPQGISALGAYQNFDNNSLALIDGVKNYIAEHLQEGMVIQDNKGRNLILVDKVITSPGQRTMTNSNGYFSIIDPERTKVTLVLEVLTEEINGHYYYRKEAPVAVDNSLHLMFDDIAVYGTIIDFEPIEDTE